MRGWGIGSGTCEQAVAKSFVVTYPQKFCVSMKTVLAVDKFSAWGCFCVRLDADSMLINEVSCE